MGKRSSFERRAMDDYQTVDPKAVARLLPFLNRDNIRTFAEPCCGEGHLFRAMQDLGFVCVLASDITQGVDALTLPNFNGADAIVTNPPWTRAVLHSMIEHFKKHVPCVWLLFDSDWASNVHAEPYLDQCSDIVACGRLKWFNDTAGKDNASWYRFDRDHRGGPRFHGRKKCFVLDVEVPTSENSTTATPVTQPTCVIGARRTHRPKPSTVVPLPVHLPEGTESSARSNRSPAGAVQPTSRCTTPTTPSQRKSCSYAGSTTSNYTQGGNDMTEPVTSVKPAMLVTEFIKLRDAKKQFEEMCAEKANELYVNRMNEIESQLLDLLNKLGVDSIAGKGGTAFKKISTSVTVADMREFRRHVIGTENWDLADWRANKTVINEMVEGGEALPPGVNRTAFATIQIRRK